MSVQNNNYAVFDFETSSVDPHTTQPLSLGCVVVDPRSLDVIEGSTFYSLIKPTDPSTVQAEALRVNRLKMEDLMLALPVDEVWKDFATHVAKYNRSGHKFHKPVPVGYNIHNFDLPIARRLNQLYSVKQFFHPTHAIDLMNYFFLWTENNPNVSSLSLDSMRELVGMSTANAHNAIQDCIDCATLLKSFVQLTRRTKVKFNTSTSTF